MIDKNKISNNFSKYSVYYDRFASIQKICAIELIDYIEEDNFKNILEIGTGTGNFTYLLSNKYPEAKITTLDISLSMLNIAKEKICKKDINFINIDAEYFWTDKKFDLITSNVSFQWFENLEDALNRYKDILSKDGIVAFSIFGKDTFKELNLSLKEFFNGRISIFADGFLDMDSLYRITNKISNRVYIKEAIYKEECNSLFELLKKIKYSGTNFIIHNRRGLFTTNILNRIQDIYIKKFGKIDVTYEVYFLKIFV